MAPRRWACSPLSPASAGLIALIGSIWSLVCGFFAVRETHKLSDGQAIVTVVIGWLVVFLDHSAWSSASAIFGIGAFGMNAMSLTAMRQVQSVLRTTGSTSAGRPLFRRFNADRRAV